MENKLSEFFKVFCDSTRIKILNTLLEKEKCVFEIAQALNISQSAVSHQLKTLRSSNLVKTKKIGNTVIYSISDDHIEIILKYGMEHIMEEKI